MLESFLLVGGLVGVACCIKHASKEHVMTWEEWQFQQRNKKSTTIKNWDNDVYRYLQEDKMFRPQILLSIIILGLVSMYSLHLESIEITTGCITLVGALGMKILESEK